MKNQQFWFPWTVMVILVGCVTPQEPTSTPYPPQQTVTINDPAGHNGAIYTELNHRFLFEDIKARRPGDLITVMLDESTNATKSASTNSSKTTDISMPTPTLFGKKASYRGREFLNNSIGSDLAFNGGADSSQSNRLTGSITVAIDRVFDNGNMHISGEKLLTLNQGSEVVRISGIVRPIDISPDNTIQSKHIANAQITYSGNGPIAESNTPGWLTRILGSWIWPF